MPYSKSMSQELNEPGLVYLHLDLLSAGAAPLTSARGGGVVSVTRSGVGQYTIKLDRQWRDLVGFYAGQALAGATAVLGVCIASGNGVSSDTIVVETRSGATPTDLAVGDHLYLHFIFNEVKVIF